MKDRVLEKEWESAIIKKTSYNIMTEVLTVEFNSGGIYDYKKVSIGLWKELIETDSAGKFILGRVKNNYEYEKV